MDFEDFPPLDSMMVQQSDVFFRYDVIVLTLSDHKCTNLCLVLDSTDCVVKYNFGLPRPMVTQVERFVRMRQKCVKTSEKYACLQECNWGNMLSSPLPHSFLCHTYSYLMSLKHDKH